MLHVMAAILYILAKSVDNLSPDFWSIKRRTPLWVSTSLNVVVQRYIIEWEIVDASLGVEKLLTTEAIYIKNLKQQLITRSEYGGRELTMQY